MKRDISEIEQTQRFDAIYDQSQSPVMQSITDDVCGCGYIGSSWSTRDEADLVLKHLQLRKSSKLLELGAGAGWPGLHLAKESGCSVTLLDLPETGIALARERAEKDGISQQVEAVVADASNVPYAPRTFSAINHSDLLCCLLPKQKALAECRRVIQDTGRMAFSVISVAPDLSREDHKEAVANGPPFIESEVPYVRMLSETGWRIQMQRDVTSDYEDACARMLQSDRRHKAELIALIGQEEYDLGSEKWANKLSAIQRRLTLREFFVVEPA